MYIHLSFARECGKVLGMPSPKMKSKNTLCRQIINSLESVGMEGTRGYDQPWKVKVMVEKGINFIFCLGTAYDVSTMESVGSSKSFSLVGKACLPKCFISIFFALSSRTSTNPYFPPRRAFLFTLCNFYFYLSLHLLL